MLKVWNLGNTTLRNPTRIELGVQVIAQHDLEGKLAGNENEKNFAKKLREEGVLKTGGSEPALLGRKWRSALVKMGFLTDKKYRIDNETISAKDLLPDADLGSYGNMDYELTPAGLNLANATTTSEINEIFLRQLMGYELPNPVDSNFPEGHMKPFVLVLQVLFELKNRAQKGLSKLEVGLFLQKFIDQDKELYKTIVNNILEYRTKRNSLDTGRRKKEFDKRLMDLLANEVGLKTSTICEDYPDTTFRYAMLSGILSFKHKRIEIKESKMEIVGKLVSEEPKFIFNNDKESGLFYLRNYYTSNPLVTDDLEFTRSQVETLVTEVSEKITQTELLNKTYNELKKVQYEMEEKLLHRKENSFAIAQMDNSAIDDILFNLKELEKNGGKSLEDVLDVPAHLEWIVWRTFLAIDHIQVPFHETRGFPLDSELKPLHHAPGGQADMKFEFADYLFAIEVTLSTSTRQVVQENEPVRRHIAKLVKDFSETKDVYGIFVAPSIDNNLADPLKNGVYYLNDEQIAINIVPLTFSHLISILETLKLNKYAPSDIKRLLDAILRHRNVSVLEWKRKIDMEVDSWIAEKTR